MTRRGQGAFEYLLLLGGTVLVATIVIVMTQGALQNANTTYDEASLGYANYTKSSMEDILANGTLTHEQPTGCMYSNPPCEEGYYCDAGTCRQMDGAIAGYAKDSLGVALSGVTIYIVGGSTANQTTDAAGRYKMAVGINGTAATYTVAAIRAPANPQTSATVGVTAGFETAQNFTLSYNAASLSGHIRNTSGAGISGATVTCNAYSATTASDGSYSISSMPMTSASTTCTLAAYKSPTFAYGSVQAQLNAGAATTGQNLTLPYANSNLSGYVRNASGAGVNGTAVSCGGSSATTAASGAYALNNIAMPTATTTCTLAASKPGYTQASAIASLSAGTATTNQNLTINIIVNGACGLSNGTSSYSAPTASLCTAGVNSTVAGTGQWKWFCNGTYGGTNATCYANKIIDGVCGIKSAYSLTSTTSGLCTQGTSNAFRGTGPWYWFCNGTYGGINASCSAIKMTAGACGTASGQYRINPPTTELCSSGTASASGSWNWYCNGTNGGSNATCAAYQDYYLYGDLHTESQCTANGGVLIPTYSGCTSGQRPMTCTWGDGLDNYYHSCATWRSPWNTGGWVSFGTNGGWCGLTCLVK